MDNQRRVRTRTVQAEQAHTDTQGLLCQQVGKDGHDHNVKPW